MKGKKNLRLQSKKWQAALLKCVDNRNSFCKTARCMNDRFIIKIQGRKIEKKLTISLEKRWTRFVTENWDEIRISECQAQLMVERR